MHVIAAPLEVNIFVVLLIFAFNETKASLLRLTSHCIKQQANVNDKIKQIVSAI